MFISCQQILIIQTISGLTSHHIIQLYNPYQHSYTDFHLIYCHEVVIMMQTALYQTYHQEHRNRKITQHNLVMFSHSINKKPSLD